MTIFEVEAHSRAIAALQALLSRHHPGTSPHRIAERALDLAFNGSCARGGDVERELLEDAEQLIALQVQAKLIGELVAASSTSRSPRHDVTRTRYLAWRGPVRPPTPDRLVQAELWLTTEERGGGGHAYRF